MDDNFSPQQSLQLIQSMISKTKENLGENRFYFLLWGWVAFSCIIGQFLLKVVLLYPHHYLVWLLCIPAAIASILFSRRPGSGTVKTYIGESMSYLWTGMGISFFIMSLIISKSQGGWLNAYPFFIMMYGLGTYVSGRILKFTPLIVGGIINWLLAVGCIFVEFDYQLLVAAAAILSSYIIPGHMFPSKKA